MSQELKAILLAAGFGKRLRPLTLNKPKCLMEINNIPLLKIWIEKLESLGCKQILINTHYLADQVHEFLKSYNSRNVKILISHEDNLLGTAGTLLKNLDFISGTTIFMHSDNYNTCDLKGLLAAHRNRSNRALLTMLTFKTSNPYSCGIVETDQKGLVSGFYEKSSKPPGNTANAAIYVFDYNFVQWLKNQKEQFIDFSTEILPRLINRVQTFHTEEFFVDIGTPDTLLLAQEKSLSKKDR